MKILVVLSRFPYPLEKGDKLRAYHQIKHLSKNNEVYLFALSDINVSEGSKMQLKDFCEEITIVRLSYLSIFFNLLLSTFKKIPFQVGYFYSSKAKRQLDRIIKKNKPDHIYCQLIRTSEYAKPYPSIPKTLDYMDVLSKGIERRIAIAPFYLKPLFSLEHKRLLKYERDIFLYFNNRTIISEQDKNLIPHPDKEKIPVIKNGVDTEYFIPIEQRKEYDILFNGNMNYPPNIESAEYLVNTILPLVKNKKPNVSVLISGANPSKKILALRSEKVFISGWTDDVRINFYRSRMLVAPMLSGTGLQNKLLEAMAMRIPCITSTLANNALNAIDGKDILVADTPEKYADHIINLLDDEKKANNIAANAYQFVTQNYSWQRENEKLEKLICS